MATFYEVSTAAVNDMAEHGFDSAERVAEWQRLLREAAEEILLSDDEVEQMLRESLGAVYRREVDRGLILRRYPGMSRFTYERIRPGLRVSVTVRSIPFLRPPSAEGQVWRV